MVPDCPVLTIGYGNRNLDEFLALLKHEQVKYLLDVRSKPYSRKKEFNKKNLEATLKANGIKYVFMGDLLGGKPKEDESYCTGGEVDYNLLREQAFFKKGIERVQDAWEKGYQIVLMCAESKPQNCHRTNLLGEELSKIDIAVMHIDEHGKLRSQEEILDRLIK